MRHSKKENYKIMEELADSNKDGIIVINGDFNVRMAEEGGLWDGSGEKEEMKSKDFVIN